MTAITFKKLLATSIFGMLPFLVISQNENKSDKNERVIHIKMIKNINGNETVVDTIIYGGNLGEIDEMMEIEMDQIKGSGNEGERVFVKTIDIRNENGHCDTNILIRSGDEGTVDLHEKLDEMGIRWESNENPQDGKKHRIIVIEENSDDIETIDKYKDSEDGKVKMRIVFKKCDIQDLDENDRKLFQGSTENSDDKMLKVEEVNFYPNPNNGRFNLSFTLINKGVTEILIYSAEGKQVYSENIPDFAGEYSKEIDLSNNSNGVYYIRVTQGKKSWFKKMIIG